MTLLTATASNGLALPRELLAELNLKPGTLFSVTTNNGSILLKPVMASNEEIRKMLRHSREWAQKVGMTEQDIQEALKEVRQEAKKQCVSS